MKILLCHNYYKYPGGEDLVFHNEYNLLKKNNHNVLKYTEDNCSISTLKDKLYHFIYLTSSRESKNKFSAVLKKNRPDIVHIHNFFPIITPSVYDVCKDQNIPVIQTLHNYRITCSSGLLLKEGSICEICIKKSPYRSIFYKCYQDSYLGTFALARMIDWHKKAKTWNENIDYIIALTEFSKSKFIESGISPSKLIVKPNFIEDPNLEKKYHTNNVLFVGRISEEKGIKFLISAWNDRTDLPPLRVIGDGPLLSEFQRKNIKNIYFLGKKSKDEIYEEMRSASCLVFPSIWYEGLPMVILEALSIGLPIIATNIGSMSDLIKNNINGLHFKHGDAEDMLNKILTITQNKSLEKELSHNARLEYENYYTPTVGYNALLKIYERAIDDHQ